jgi:hypothetical protein
VAVGRRPDARETSSYRPDVARSPGDAVTVEGVTDDGPMDPFFGDPMDPAAALGDEDVAEPLAANEREEVLSDLEDLEVFEALLAPNDFRGIVIDCEDCREPHYFSWDLMRANLRHLLDAGETRVHEPAFSPEPSQYVSWEYARGYADGVLASVDEGQH